MPKLRYYRAGEVIKWSLNRQIRHLEKGKSQKESHNLKPDDSKIHLSDIHAPQPPYNLNEIIKTFGCIYDYIKENGNLYWSWEQDMIGNCELPFSIPSIEFPDEPIKHLMCHKILIQSFRLIFKEIYNRGLHTAIDSLGKCYEYNPSLKKELLPLHCWGIAIDIRFTDQTKESNRLKKRQILEIFSEKGFRQDPRCFYCHENIVHLQYSFGN